MRVSGSFCHFLLPSDRICGSTRAYAPVLRLPALKVALALMLLKQLRFFLYLCLQLPRRILVELCHRLMPTASHDALTCDARMHVRRLSEEFIAEYLDQEWPAISGCVGCYRVEGLGAQLFARTEGSQFTIMGMPLLPILDYLRTRGVMTS